MTLSGAELPYRTLRPWLLETYGKPMHRVALDAGSTCPNRDGTRGYGGCVYCDVEGSGTGALKTGLDLAQQLETGIARVARRDPDDFGVIAYFQSYSNTYVSPERLDEVLVVLEERLADPIAAVALSTRPDTLPPWAVERLARLAEKVPVWLELGLESASDQVLLDIHRLHTLAEFEDAVKRAHDAGLLVVGHAILGLPGDGRDGARRTAEALARSGCSGVKVHHLMVLRRTVLANWWKEGRVDLLDPDTYVEWLADFVERLAPEQVLHRLTGDAPAEHQLAPCWTVHKSEIRQRLGRVLLARGTRQGSLFEG
ncbi:MAG: tRNA modification radical SAM protein MnmL/YtqA [Planctomycetota bacterium]|jgi:radical SAM protein (TIGR01212 family)